MNEQTMKIGCMVKSKVLHVVACSLLVLFKCCLIKYLFIEIKKKQTNHRIRRKQQKISKTHLDDDDDVHYLK